MEEATVPHDQALFSELLLWTNSVNCKSYDCVGRKFVCIFQGWSLCLAIWGCHFDCILWERETEPIATNRSPQNIAGLRKNEHLLSHTMSLGQGSGMGLARRFGSGSVMAVVIWRLGWGHRSSSMLHMVGVTVLAVGRVSPWGLLLKAGWVSSWPRGWLCSEWVIHGRAGQKPWCFLQPNVAGDNSLHFLTKLWSHFSNILFWVGGDFTGVRWRVLISQHPWNLVIWLFDDSHPSGYDAVFLPGVGLHSPDDVKKLSNISCAYAIHMSSLHLLKLGCLFSYWLVRVLLFPLLINTSPLSDFWLANISSHSMGCLVTFLVVSFEAQKFLVLMKFNLFFLLLLVLLVLYLSIRC